MALDLDSLVFNVDTKQLQDAVDSLGKLADAMNNVAVAETKKVQAQKSDEASQKEVTKTTRQQVDILQKHNDIVAFMTQGYSKGQASTLAMAKASGLLTSEIAELGKVLQTQRTLMGTDPFDKSIGAMQSLRNEYTVTKEVQRLYNDGIALTRKQMEDLARDKLRLIEAAKIEGKTLSEVKAEVYALESAYVRNASAENKVSEKIKTKAQAMKELAKAEQYLVDNEAKLAATNELVARGFTIASANALIKYKEALDAAGVSAIEAKQRIYQFEQALMQKQGTSPFAKMQKDVEGLSAGVNHLARNIGTQFTDIWVSLANGQGLFQVLTQQGGQLADAFALMKDEGVDASEALVAGFKKTYQSWGVLYQGFKGLIAKGLSTVGEAATSSVSSIRRMIEIQAQYEAGVISATRQHRLLYVAQGQFLKSVGVMATTLGVTLAAAAGALAIAYFNVSEEIQAMQKAAVLNGATMGLSADRALYLSTSLKEVGVSGTKGREILTEMAKAGGFTSGQFEAIAVSVKTVASATDQSIGEVIKKFAEVNKDPMEALRNLQIAQGNVSTAVMDNVSKLIEQGDTVKATKLAMQEYARASKEVADEIISSLPWYEELGKWLNGLAQSMWDFAKAALGAESNLRKLEKVNQDLANAEKGDTPWWVTFVPTADYVNGLKAQQKALQGVVSSEEEVRKQREKNATVEGANKLVSDELRKVMDENSKLNAKEVSKEEYVSKMTNRRLDELARQNGLIRDSVKYTELRGQLETKFANEWSDRNKKETKAKEVRDNTLSELTKTHNARLSMLKSVTEAERSVLQDSLDMGLIDRAEYVAKDLQLVKSQYDKLRAENESYLADYEAAFSKQYTKEKNADKRSNLVREFEAVKESVRSAGATLDAELGKKRQDILKQLGVETKKLGEDFKAFQKSLEDVAEARAYEIQMQQAMVGLSEEEQIRLKATSDTYRSLVPEINKFAKALEEADKEYQALLGTGDLSAIWEAFRKRQDAEFYYIEAVKARRVAADKAGIDAVLKYELDERKKLADSLTDSIVTALIDGGKEGSKKIRQMIEAKLREPVTLVVNAVVNAVLNDVLGAVGLGSGGGTLGAISQGMSLFSAGSSLLDVASQGFTNVIGKQFDKVINSPVGEALGLSKSTVDFTFNDQAEVIKQTTYEIEDFGKNLKEVGTALVATYLGGKIGNAISGGYRASSGANTVFDIAAVAASVFGSNPFIGGLIKIAQGVFNRFFGRKTISSGVQGFFQGSTGTFAGSQWEFQKGGTFRSDKTINSAVAEETQAMFDGLFGLAVESVKGFAKQLGLGTDALKNFKYFVQLDLFNKSPEEQQKLLEGAVSGLTEAVAKELLFAAAGGTGITDKQTRIEELNTLMQNRGARKKTWQGWESERNKLQEEVDKTIAETLKDFVKYGETYVQALERMSTNLNTLNASFDILGWKLYDVSLAGAGAAGTFADLFGGLDQAKSALSTYYDNFYSEQEQTDNLLRVTTEAFKLLGLQIPKTREGFRALVESARAAGDDVLVANLLALQGNIINLTPAVQGLATVFGVMLDTIDNLDIQMLQNRARMLSGTSSTDLQGISAVLTAIPAHADGGAYRGGLALVGEQGPEIIDFSSSGTVYNASKTARMLDESGSDTDTKRSLENISHETRANSIHLAKLSKMLDSVIEQDYLKTKAVAA